MLLFKYELYADSVYQLLLMLTMFLQGCAKKVMDSIFGNTLFIIYSFAVFRECCNGSI